MSTIEAIEARLGDLGTVDPEAAAAVRAEIDPNDAESVTYFGVKAQREATRLTDQMAQTGASASVRSASALLQRMLERLANITVNDKPAGFLSRLIGRSSRIPSRTRLKETAGEIDRIAAELEGCSTPLLTETVLLERREQALQAIEQQLGAHLRAGLDAADALKAHALQRDLLGRLEDLVMARVVAQQALATLQVLKDNRRQLHERIRFVLNHALPLWHQQLSLVRQTPGGEPAEALSQANETFRDALEAPILE